jgi:nucleotide-binding universal stress UspA family protein
MTYKTILVDINATSGAAGRIDYAVRLAGEQQAHLVGLTQTGIFRFLREIEAPGADFGDVAPLFEQLRHDADERAAQFDERARQAGIVSFGHLIGDTDAGIALASQAMYADLVIVSQRDPADASAAVDAAVPEYVAMHAPCPVLVMPCASKSAPVFDRVLVAWNASPEASRAVRGALPFLVQAKDVVIAIVERNDRGRVRGPEGGADIARFLERHGVKAGVRHESTDGDVAERLLALADECGAGLLVMGCYGHARFREMLLGGVSRTILQRMTLPVLLSH